MEVYNVQTIKFRNGIVDTRIYKRAIEGHKPSAEEKEERYINRLEPRQLSEKELKDNQRRSADRARQHIYEIARNYSWDWFVTLTLNSKYVDRYNYDECSKKVSQWLKNLKKKCPEMVYIFVPEQHKDGAFHFHGLIANCYDLCYTDSGHKSGDDIIYNLDSYKFGWSTMTRVKQNDAVVKYLTKYITKELIQTVKGRKKYWASRNCERPEKSFSLQNSMDRCFLWQELSENPLYSKESINKYNDIMYFQNQP